MVLTAEQGQLPPHPRAPGGGPKPRSAGPGLQAAVTTLKLPVTSEQRALQVTLLALGVPMFVT